MKFLFCRESLDFNKDSTTSSISPTLVQHFNKSSVTPFVSYLLYVKPFWIDTESSKPLIYFTVAFLGLKWEYIAGGF